MIAGSVTGARRIASGARRLIARPSDHLAAPQLGEHEVGERQRGRDRNVGHAALAAERLQAVLPGGQARPVVVERQPGRR